MLRAQYPQQLLQSIQTMFYQNMIARVKKYVLCKGCYLKWFRLYLLRLPAAFHAHVAGVHSDVI